MAKSKLSAKKTAAPTPAPRKRRTALLSRDSKHQALDRATGKIRSLARSTAVNVWRLGRVLSEVASLKLYTGRGFTTLDAYIEGEAKLSLTFAYQAMRVSQVFTEEVVAVFGAEKLDQGLRYIAATPEPETPADVPRMTVRVRGEAGVREVPFERATIRELRESTHAEVGAAAKKKRAPKGLTDEELADLLARSNKALDAAVGRADAAGAAVVFKRHARGTLVAVEGVPVAKAAKALREVAKALPRG